MKKIFNNKILFSLIIVFLIISSLLVGTWALYTDRQNDMEAAKIGKLEIILDMSPMETSQIYSQGDVFALDYNISNKQNTAADIKEIIYLTITDEKGSEIAVDPDNLPFTVYSESDTQNTPGKGYSIIDDASPLGEIEVDNNVIKFTIPTYTLDGNNNLDEYQIIDGSKGDSTTGESVILFDSTFGNDHSKLLLNIDIIIEGKQHFNTIEDSWQELEVVSYILSTGETVKVVRDRTEGSDFTEPLAQDASENWNYTINEKTNTITLTNYKGTNTTAVVLNKYSVNGVNYNNVVIGNSDENSGPFHNSKSTLTGIKIANGVKFSESTSYMFANCEKLESLNVSNWNMSSVKDISHMFENTTNLTSISGIDDWNVSNVADMSYLFSYSAINSLDITGWTTTSLTDMNSMFYNCTSLTDIAGLNTIDVSKVKNISNMFNSCRKLTTLTFSNWTTNNLLYMDAFLKDCSTLSSVSISNLNLSKVASLYEVFSGCRALTTIDLSNWNTSKVTNMSKMFYYCNSLTSIEGISNWQVENLENLNNAFYYCSKLPSLDLSGWVTTNLTDTGSMFENCSKLTKVIQSFNTSKITNMSNMFKKCKVLSSIDVSGWNTEKVLYMQSMFYECNVLRSLKVDNWNVSNVIDMNNMFNNCQFLTSLNVSNWNPSSAKDMNKLFYYCCKLTSLDLSNWNTVNLENISYMFASCDYLETITGIENLDVSKVNNMVGTFFYCEGLTSLNLVGWDFSGLDPSLTEYQSQVYYMFYGTGPINLILKDQLAYDFIVPGDGIYKSKLETSATVSIGCQNYNVAFFSNGGYGTMDNQAFSYGVAQKLSANTFTNPGYSFSGWSTSAIGSVEYTDGQSVINLKTDGSTLNLYAIWTPTTYKVSFNANGGSGTMNAQTFTYGTAQALTANKFTRTGFTFAGWSTSATGSVVYSNSQSVKNLKTDGTTLTLYAVWNLTTTSWTYTSNDTFTVPKTGTYTIEMHGGGGGGGGGALAYSHDIDDLGYSIAGGGGGGGSGETYTTTLTAGTSYAITIGAGGTGGAKAYITATGSTGKASAGSDGGTTSFGSLYSVSGGKGGTGGTVELKSSKGFATSMRGYGGAASGSLASAGSDGEYSYQIVSYKTVKGGAGGNSGDTSGTYGAGGKGGGAAGLDSSNSASAGSDGQPGAIIIKFIQ